MFSAKREKPQADQSSDNRYDSSSSANLAAVSAAAIHALVPASVSPYSPGSSATNFSGRQNLDSLNADVLSVIVKNLDLHSITQLSRVNKKLHDFVQAQKKIPTSHISTLFKGLALDLKGIYEDEYNAAADEIKIINTEFQSEMLPWKSTSVTRLLLNNNCISKNNFVKFPFMLACAFAISLLGSDLIVLITHAYDKNELKAPRVERNLILFNILLAGLSGLCFTIAFAAYCGVTSCFVAKCVKPEYTLFTSSKQIKRLDDRLEQYNDNVKCIEEGVPLRSSQ